MPATEKIKAEWAEAGPGLFNAAYEASGPDKHEIEEMVTDAEYEARVVLCVMEAWSSWTADGRPTEELAAQLPFPELIRIVSEAS